MKVACDCWLDTLKILVAQVKKSCTLGSKGPFVKIGEVCIRLKFSHIDFDLIHGMSCINEHRNTLFLEEDNQILYGTNKSRNGDDVIKDCQFDLLWVAVDKVFNF